MLDLPHLDPEFSPITVVSTDCMYSPSDSYRQDALNVNYSGTHLYWENHNIANGGKDTFFISPVDTRSKYSEGYYDCGGVVISGVKDTKVSKAHPQRHNISTLSHGDPKRILDSSYMEKKFRDSLARRALKLKKEAVSGSVDVVLFGSAEFDDFCVFEELTRATSKILEETLGFPCRVGIGPRCEGWDPTAGYFFAESSRLLVRKPTQSDSYFNEGFPIAELDTRVLEYRKRS